MSGKRIDLNSDLGESFGVYKLGLDEEVIPHLTSANIACGFHAGDPAVMRKTVSLARQHGVEVGAHPGFPDLLGIGRSDFGNGFNFNVWSAQPGSSGEGSWSTVNQTNFQYTPYYKNTIWEDGCLMTNYVIGYRFYDFTDMASNDADLQEMFVELSWPNLIGNGFTPRYAYYHMWNSEGSGMVRKFSGPIHDFGLDYAWTFEQAPELPMKFSWDIVYNDGTGTVVDDAGNYLVGPVDHDWSHMVWGLSTSIQALGGKITPGIWYQNSMEDTVNTEDELWGGISYSISF